MNKPDQRLTNLQIELLKAFSYELSEEQLLEVKVLLAKYFAGKATDEMDALWDKNSWSKETMKSWSQEHMRTPYRSANS
jgi:hypothetical protein